MINHVDAEMGKERAKMNAQFDAQEAIAKGLGEKLELIMEALAQPTQAKSVTLPCDDNEGYIIVTPPTIIYDDDCQVEDGDEVESGVCKTSVGEKPVRMRKRSRFYLSPYANDPNRFGEWRKKDKPR